MKPLDPLGRKRHFTARIGPSLRGAIETLCAADRVTRAHLIACGVALYASHSGRAEMAQAFFPASGLRLKDDPDARAESAQTCATPLAADDPRRLAAAELQGQFAKLARRLAPGDAATQDDLCTAMAIGVLEARKSNETVGYYAQVGECRGRDWLRKHRLRSRPDLKLRAVAKSEMV